MIPGWVRPTRWVLIASGVSMALAALAEAATDDRYAAQIAIAALVTLACGAAAIAVREPDRSHSAPRLYASLMVTSVLAVVAGGLPFLFAGVFDRWDDAFIESISGFTTTGATMALAPESLGRGLLLWRAMSQWIGGAGVIVMIVLVFPTTGMGGLDVGGGVATRSARRIAARAGPALRRLLGLYAIVTVVVAASYRAAGMGAFDAATHGLTTSLDRRVLNASWLHWCLRLSGDRMGRDRRDALCRAEPAAGFPRRARPHTAADVVIDRVSVLRRNRRRLDRNDVVVGCWRSETVGLRRGERVEHDGLHQCRPDPVSSQGPRRCSSC